MKQVKLPDGSIVGFPDEMSDDSILQVLRQKFPPTQQQDPQQQQQAQQQPSGLAEAMQNPAYQEQGRSAAGMRSFLNEATLGLGRDAIAAGRAAPALFTGSKDFLPEYERQAAFEKAQLAGGEKEYGTTTALSGLTGGVATSIALTPARVAGWINKSAPFLERAAKYALVSAPVEAFRATQNLQEGETVPQAAQRGLETAAIAGPLGATLEKGVGAVTNVGRALVGGAKKGPITEAEKVIQAGKEANIPIRTTDVFPPQSWLGKRLQQATDRIPVIGTGGGLVKTQESRRKATEDFVNQYVPEAQTDPVWLKEISKDVQTKHKEKLKTFKEMKNTVLSKPEYNVGEPITTPNFLKAIDEEMVKIQKPLNAERKTIAQEKAKANAIGAEYKPLPTPYETKMNELISWRGQATNNEGLGALETVRGDLSAKYATDPTMFDFANKLYPHLREDMGNFLKSQNPSDYKKWRNGNKGLEILADETKRTSLSRVINKGNVVPEAAKSLILSSKPSEVANINRYLEPAGRENAKKVIIEDLMTRSTPKDSTSIDPDKFLQVVSQRQNQFKTFFSKQEQDALEGLTRALRATTEAGKYEKSRPWLQTLVSSAPFLGIGVGVSTKAAAGAAAITGVGGRVYQSKAMRNTLVALGRVKQNSTAERRLIDKLISLQAGQATAREITGE